MLETIGYGPAVAAAFAPWAAADASVGRVLRLDAGAVAVLSETGLHRVGLGGCLLQQVAQDPAASPCAGDWVVLREWPDRRVTLEAVLPRRTSLADPAGVGRPPLCANIDVLAVLAGGRGDQVTRLDRLAAEARDVEVVVCRAPVTGPGRLRDRIDGRLTVALAGPRRARAALIRSVLGVEPLGDPGEGPALVAVPGGGALVDVPGLLELGQGRGLRPSGSAP